MADTTLLWLDIPQNDIKPGFDSNGLPCSRVSFPMTQNRRMAFYINPDLISKDATGSLGKVHLGVGANQYEAQFEYPDGQVLNGRISAKDILNNYNEYVREMYQSRYAEQKAIADTISAKNEVKSDTPKTGFLSKLRGGIKDLVSGKKSQSREEMVEQAFGSENFTPPEPTMHPDQEWYK